MPLTATEQIRTAITQSNHTLVCFPEHAGGDGVATALGIALALEQMRPGHQVDVASSGFDATHAQRFRFLPGADRVRNTARREQQLTIRIPVDDPNAVDIRHAVTNGMVEVTLRAAAGLPSPSRPEAEHEGVESGRAHIEHALTEHSYECIIVVDCPDLASLGKLYNEHADLFQRTPIIALDHAPDHERYGQIHAIDVTASACGEVAATLLRDLHGSALNADIATCLLTGILVKTRSFRSPRMGPRTFEVVGYLLACGARREEVVAHLFQTKSVGQLQLWGRALTRLKHDAARGLVWTLLAQHDFLSVGATPADLADIVDELIASSPDAQCALLITEHEDRSIHVTAAVPRGRYDAAHLLRPLGGTGSAVLATATLPAGSLQAAEARILASVRARIT